jgi:aspartyl/glutamyl-tRNA(Asn/Gln) amidotransferase C subunit
MPDPSSISEADVRKVAKLARLHISDADVSQHQQALAAVIGYMDTLKSLDLTAEAAAGAVHAGAGGDGFGSHLGEDEVGPTLSNESLMKLAPLSMPPFVMVPKVLDDGGGA